MKPFLLTLTALLIYVGCSCPLLWGQQEIPLTIDTLTLAETQLEVRVLAEDLYIPWDLSWSPDGWVWLSERDGTISRLRPQNGFLQHIFTIEEAFESGENSGMHALALHPDFPEVPYVYAHYTFWWVSSRLTRFTFDETTLTLKDPLILMDSLPANSSHNGSRIVFSPDKDHLFLALGDAYDPTQVQDTQAYNGKILRLHLDGSIPADNPFPGSPVWSLGHRNPQGLVMTPNGRLYNTEHGDATNDELNLVQKGRNYGWPKVEGNCNFPPEVAFCEENQALPPIYAWIFPTYAVCGMDYYDHDAIPEWRNSILVASLKAGRGEVGQRLQQFSLDERGDSVLSFNDYFVQTFGRLRDVMVSSDGRVFVCTSNREVNGDLVRQDTDDRIIEIRNLNVNYDTSLPESDEVFDAMWIGPIPLFDELSISFLQYNGLAEISLIGVNGSLVWEESVDFRRNRATLQLPTLVSGVYVLQIKLEDGRTHLQKVMVEE